MTNWDFDWKPIAIAALILGGSIGLIYLGEKTDSGWGVSVAASVGLSFIVALIANGGWAKKGAISVSGGEGQGPWYSRPILVFGIMLVATIVISIIAHSER